VHRKPRGFNLIELLIVVAVVAILAAIAYPSYRQHVVRVSREAAQSQLMELANLQEKIFLNDSAYMVTNARVATGYNGHATGGLGVSYGKCAAGQTADCRYAVSVAGTATTFTLTATPVSGTTQTGDGWLAIDQSGQRTWQNHDNW